MTEYRIRLLEKLSDGLDDTRQDYGVEELGGVIPAVGDFIVEPGVTEGLDRRQPENRTVYEVVARYFTPGDYMGTKSEAPKYSYVRLVVKSRKGRWDEIDVLGA